MKQIDYFKFLKAFPRLIDIDDTDDVKLALLKELRRMTWKNKEFVRLLPILVWRNLITPEELKEKGFLAAGYIIKHKKKSIFKIAIIEEHTQGEKIPHVAMCRLYNNLNQFGIDFSGEQMFMSKGEIKNMKRTLLMDDMLKNKNKK